MTASTYANLQGTMARSFRISKGGPSIIPGVSDPNVAALAGNPGDLYIQYGAGSTPQVFINTGPTTWQPLSQSQTFNRYPVTTPTFTATNAQYYIGVRHAGAVVTLPPGTSNKEFVIKDELGLANQNMPISVVASGSDTIDGQTTFLLTGPYAAIELVFGDEWHVL